MGVWPAPGAGVECTPDSPADCGVPPDTPIELRFDRHLLPSTAVRQSVVVATGDNAVFLSPTYDPSERVVVYRPPYGNRWMAGVRYTVTLVRPDEDPEGWGFRAFDGALLTDSGPAPLSFTFRVRRDPATAFAPVPPPPTFAEASEILSGRGCSGAGCHRSPEPEACAEPGAVVEACRGPRMGLELDSADGLERTALGHVAHQTDTGPYAGQTQAAGVRFGVGMPIVAEASPGNSYLVYKLLVNERLGPEADPCATRYSAPVPDDCAAATADDVARLRSWFVRGAPMPLGATGPEPRLTHHELQVVIDWIAGGALLD